MLLLHHFGSVARLKKARAKEIASIKGISEQWATTLLDFLLNN
jgi:excinuclease UvrABC nuclease subunit